MAQTLPARTEVRAALSVSPTDPIVTHAWAAYAAAATAESAGAIRFQMMIGNQHMAVENALAALATDLADAAFLPTPLWPAALPHQRLITDLALLGTDAIAMTGAISEFVLGHCLDCQRELNAQGVVYTGGFSSGYYLALAHQRVIVPQALRAMRIRTPGRAWNRWAAAFNALPVGVEDGDLREALRSGALDAAIVSVDKAQALDLWSVSGHAALQPLGTVHAGAPAAFSLGFWRRTPAAVRKILLANAATATLGAAFRFYELDREALQKATGEGFTLYQPEGRLIATHERFVEADLDMITGEASAYGIRNARNKIDLLARLAKKWTALADGVDHDRAKLAALLRDEIYSKLDGSEYGG